MQPLPSDRKRIDDGSQQNGPKLSGNGNESKETRDPNQTKANEVDHSEMKRELEADMTDLVTSQDLENLQQEVSAITRGIVTKGMQELEEKITSDEDMKYVQGKLLTSLESSWNMGTGGEAQSHQAEQSSVSLADLTIEVMEQCHHP